MTTGKLTTARHFTRSPTALFPTEIDTSLVLTTLLHLGISSVLIPLCGVGICTGAYLAGRAGLSTKSPTLRMLTFQAALLAAGRTGR